MNIYITKIKSISHKNKYTNWYISIITTALNRIILEDVYYEKHHIIPKSFKMGGEKNKLNLVYLTAREHFIVHMLLVKMTINTQLRIKMACALVRMISNKYNNSKTYETARKIYYNNHPSKNPEMRKKVRQTNLFNLGVEYPMQNDVVKEKSKKTLLTKYGVDNTSKDINTKIKKAQKSLEKFGCENVFQNEDIKQKSKETMLEKYGVENINQLEENRRKISERVKLRWKQFKPETCPHCNKTGRGPSFRRHHFDKCKLK